MNKINATWSYVQHIFIKCLLCARYMCRKEILTYCVVKLCNTMNTFSHFCKTFCSLRYYRASGKKARFCPFVSQEKLFTCQFPAARIIVVLRDKHTQTPLRYSDGGLLSHNLLGACCFSFRKISSEDEIRSLRLNSISKMGFSPKIIKARNRANFAVIPLIW